jgi:hypothetical protein
MKRLDAHAYNMLELASLGRKKGAICFFWCAESMSLQSRAGGGAREPNDCMRRESQTNSRVAGSEEMRIWWG